MACVQFFCHPHCVSYNNLTVMAVNSIKAKHRSPSLAVLIPTPINKGICYCYIIQAD